MDSWGFMNGFMDVDVKIQFFSPCLPSFYGMLWGEWRSTIRVFWDDMSTIQGQCPHFDDSITVLDPDNVVV